MTRFTEQGYPWTAAELAECTGGKWTQLPTQPHAERVAYLLRLVVPNALLVAHDDRWDFGISPSLMGKLLPSVFGVIAQRGVSGIPSSTPILFVDDIYDAVYRLAVARRETFQGRAVVVTGSAGKSSVCRMLRDVLSGFGKSVWGNTEIDSNLPEPVAAVLGSMPTRSDALVIEIAIGRVERSSRLVRPDVAIVTAISEAHMAHFGSLKQIALKKAEIFRGLSPDGVAVINGEADWAELLVEQAKKYVRRVLTYGTGAYANVRLVEAGFDDSGNYHVTASLGDRQFSFELGIPGKHMAMNAMAVLAATEALDLNVEEAAGFLVNSRAIAGRGALNRIELTDGRRLRVIDESYNANPLSVRASLENLAAMPVQAGGRRIAVLGDMLELGPQSIEFHEQLLPSIEEARIDQVYLIGGHMYRLWQRLPENKKGGYAGSREALVDMLVRDVRDQDLICVKASHGMQLGRAIESLAAKPDTPQLPLKPLVLKEPAASFVFDVTSGAVLFEHDADRHHAPASLVKLMTLFLIFDALSAGKITLEQRFAINPKARSIRGSSVDLNGITELLVHDALALIALVSANNVTLALALHLVESVDQFVVAMNRKGRELGLNNTFYVNPTGLDATGQHTCARDVGYLLASLYKHHPSHLHWLALRSCVFRGEVLYATNLLLDQTIDIQAGKTGTSPKAGCNMAILAVAPDGRKIAAVVLGCRDEHHRMFQMASLLEAVALTDPAGRGQTGKLINLESAGVDMSISGDVYFGEWHMVNRRKRGQEDILARGYGDTFSAFRSFLRERQLNIANYEAALTNHDVSPFQGAKEYLFRGDPEKSIACLREERIDVVTLANNHLFDYGFTGLQDTLTHFASAGIPAIGAGYNAREALTPLELMVENAGTQRRIALFSGYQFTEQREKRNRCYALPGRWGVACLSSMADAIKRYREKWPESYIVAIPHWGTDYRWVLPSQRRNAEWLLAGGADIIIGHGAHMLQEIERISRRWVIFSLGNFILNGQGEYAKRNVPPYSLISRISLQPSGTGWAGELKLYPFVSDNLATNWHPRFVFEEEFLDIVTLLQVRAARGDAEIELEFGVDQYGWHFRFDISK